MPWQPDPRLLAARGSGRGAPSGAWAPRRASECTKRVGDVELRVMPFGLRPFAFKTTSGRLALLAVLWGSTPVMVHAQGVADSLPLHLFAYDRAAPVALRDSLRLTDGDGVAVYAVSFASPRGGRATGVLCVPPGSGPFAGVLLQHGMPGNAEQTLVAARNLARHGAVVLSLDAPWARRGGRVIAFTPQDSADQVQLITDMQRGVDVLVARRDVDPARLAYVGVSYGGAVGALPAGVERRLKTYILTVGDGGG